MTFSSLLSGLADAVFTEFGDAEAVLYPVSGEASATVRADVSRGTSEVTLERGRLIGVRALVRIPFADAPALKIRDELDALDPVEQRRRRWRLAGAPQRFGQGLVWEAEIEALS